ncbi:MAG: prephenate dehydratase [Lachnospiraceae bacterium]|nr:prephenate dehydratase [Lachnospiraceae bacterium]
MKDLLELRDEIDVVDRTIVELYEKRLKLCTEVASYKIQTGKAVFDPERETAKLNTLSGLVEGDFMKNGVKELFTELMTQSRKKQYQLLTEHGVEYKTEHKVIDDIKSDGLIIYQGVPGAYAEAAMFEFFGKDIKCKNVPSWRDAMECIKNEEASYAVLPFENSSAGIVTENYDLLREYGLHIVGEQILPIKHCLLGVKGAKLSDIKKVYSHPQALAQCSNLFKNNPDFERVELKNTALAAKFVSDEGNPSNAAVANRLTAELYGLEILKEAIQDNDNNETRFIVVGKAPAYKKDAGKISILVELKHESGSLYHALGHFIYNSLNMTSIESRPIPGKKWEYQFFIDFEGNLSDPAVLNALRGLKEEANSLLIFGNY